MTMQGTHFIDNRWIEGQGAVFSSKDPATGQTTWEGTAATYEEVNQAVAAARAAFEAWGNETSARRIAYLEAFRERLSADRDKVAEAICRDVGKPRWEALTEVDAMIGKIAISIEAYHDRCRLVTGELAGAATALRFKPHGVVVVIGPFNMPGHLPNGHIVPALLAGNTVVFKPSGQAALVGQEMVHLWQEVGIPPGVLNMTQGRKETGSALSHHPGIDGLFFTGGADTGKALHKAFGGRPEKILALEMGGNNPLVVFEVSDLQSAAYLTILSAYITSGQRCTCARRLIIPAGSEGHDFLEILAARTKKIRVGPYTDDPEPFMGPVISHQVAKELLRAQERLGRGGGKSLLEMKSLNGRINMLTPSLMDVTDVADRPDVELFGPFLQIIRVPDFDAAVKEAENTTYGLAAGLISDNQALYDRFYRKIRAGVVNWNRQTTGASSKMPFGGIKASGNHRPSAYFAADYCSYPVASIESEHPAEPTQPPPGLDG